MELNELNNLINELNSREIPEIAHKIDAKINFLNNLQENQKILRRHLEYHKDGCLGLPIGIAIFASTGNPAF